MFQTRSEQRVQVACCLAYTWVSNCIDDATSMTVSA